MIDVLTRPANLTYKNTYEYNCEDVKCVIKKKFAIAMVMDDGQLTILDERFDDEELAMKHIATEFESDDYFEYTIVPVFQKVFAV